MTNFPFNITFRNLKSSDAIWSDVKEHIDKLEKFYRHILSCDVIISIPHQHHKKGKVPHISIHLHIPGDHLAVNREPEKHESHEDLYVAIAHGFKAMERQLEDHVRRHRQHVKEEKGPSLAFVKRMFQGEDYGFIETPEGRELYFNKNSVLKETFKNLKIGTEVRFSEEESLEGPKVTSMTPVRSSL